MLFRSGIDIAIGPEEVLTIVSEQNKLKYIPVPEGWYSLLGITEEIGKISVQKVKKLLEKYRESSPEYFRQFLNPVNSRAFEYVNQKIVDAIKNDLARDTAPTGWVKITDLASEVHRSSPTLLQFIQQIESNEPIAGKFRTQNKGQSAHFVSPEIASKIRSEFSLIERAPDGWKSEIELARELGIDPRTLRKIVDQQVGPNQDGSGIFLNATNIPIRHYSQELIDSLKGTSQLAPKEPGWTTNYSLAREFKVSESTVAETAARLSADHPEWTQIMNKEGSVRRSYNDQLSTLIRIELAERVKTNPEFISANETAALLNLDLNSVNRSLAEIAKTHPELVTVQRSKSGQLTPHIHQDALKMIEAHREKPKGYFSLQEASRLLGRHPATTEKYARRVAAEKFPDGIVEKPIIGTEKSEVYIKPEILEEIEVELAKFQPAPEGWISFAQFRKNTGHSTKWIENRLAQLKALHPQGVGKYYDSLNRPIDFFSPEAVKYLEEFEGTK